MLVIFADSIDQDQTAQSVQSDFVPILSDKEIFFFSKNEIWMKINEMIINNNNNNNNNNSSN